MKFANHIFQDREKKKKKGKKETLLLFCWLCLAQPADPLTLALNYCRLD